MIENTAIRILIVYSVLFLIGLSSEYKTMMNLRTVIKYPDAEVHDLTRGIIRVQDDTPLFIARGIVANDILKLEKDIRDSGFEKSEYNRLFTLLVLYEAGQYWEEGNDLINKAIQEAPNDPVTYKIATNMREYFASGLSNASPPSLTDDIGKIIRQSMVLMLLMASAIIFAIVSLKRSDLTTRQKMYVKSGASFLALTYLGLIYLRLYY